MIVSHAYKFIYYAPQKTGTSTIENTLQRHFQALILGKGNSYPRHEMFKCEELNDYFSFVSVRNPFDRFLSSFNFFSKPEQTLDDWVRKNWIPECISDKLFLNNNPIKIDAIIRQENLESDFNRLPFVSFPIKLPKYNAASKIKITSLNQNAIEFVKKKYYYDFKFFGYDMNYGDIAKKIKII